MKPVSFIILLTLFASSSCVREQPPAPPTSPPTATPAPIQGHPTANNSSGGGNRPGANWNAGQPTTDAAIEAEIRKIVADNLGLGVHEIDTTTPLAKLRNPADALDLVELIMTLEEQFDITIGDNELGGSDINSVEKITVKDLADLVVSKKRGS